jgi:hypothetical protein
MPFELGMACALSRLKGHHAFFIFEREKYRLDKTLSDLKGCDPAIYDGTPADIIRVVLDIMDTARAMPSFETVLFLYQQMAKEFESLKRKHKASGVTGIRVYRDLIAFGTEMATAIKLL